MATVDDLRDQLADMERRAVEATVEESRATDPAAAARAGARRAKYQELVAFLEAEIRRLTSEDRLSTIEPVNATPTNALRSKKQLDANAGHKFVAMLKRTDTTVLQVASYLETKHPERKKVPRNTVQAWYKKTSDTGFRRIPMWAAKAIEAKYGVPLDAWPRIIPE